MCGHWDVQVPRLGGSIQGHALQGWEQNLGSGNAITWLFGIFRDWNAAHVHVPQVLLGSSKGITNSGFHRLFPSRRQDGPSPRRAQPARAGWWPLSLELRPPSKGFSGGCQPLPRALPPCSQSIKTHSRVQLRGINKVYYFVKCVLKCSWPPAWAPAPRCLLEQRPAGWETLAPASPSNCRPLPPAPGKLRSYKDIWWEKSSSPLTLLCARTSSSPPVCPPDSILLGLQGLP